MRRDIGAAVVAHRFRKRQRTVAAVVALAAVGVPPLGALAFLERFGPSFLKPPELLLALAVSLAVIALSVFYVLYRCPNCNARPWGKGWVGFSPRRCPSCKIGLAVPTHGPESHGGLLGH